MFKRKATIILSSSLLLSSCSSLENINLGSVAEVLLNSQQSGNSIELGLKDALKVGTERAVASLSKNGGYSNNSALKILMPEKLQKVSSTLRNIGMGSMVDNFEAKMNEAAEKAAAKAAPVFFDSIRQITFDDAQKLLSGQATAITDFFSRTTRSKLKGLYQPLVSKKMRELGTVQQYDQLMSRYQQIPFAPKVDFTLEDYVTEQALDGLFSQLASVEKDIRANPAARTTALLRKVFAK